jgi:uncharacterized membrane protein YtjA (UPF0391 family)
MIDDGRLDICLIDEMPTVEFLALLKRVSDGEHVDDTRVSYFQGGPRTARSRGAVGHRTNYWIPPTSTWRTVRAGAWQAFRVCLLMALTAAPMSSDALKPDFSSSVVAHAPEMPREGDLITYTLVASNTGSDSADATWIVFDWPDSGYFVGVRGLDRPEVDHEGRRIEGYIPMPAGSQRRVELDILTPRDSAGLTFSLRVRVSDLSSGTDHYDSHSVAIDSRIATGLTFGGLRVTPAGVAVLTWFAAVPVVWLLVSLLTARKQTNRSRRWRTSPAALTFMLMLPLAFWAIFAVMAWRDYQSVTSWRQAECTVMGRRVVAESVSSTGTGRTRSTNNTVYSPELALRYTAEGHTMISTGYDTGSSLRIGGRARRERETLAWPVGTAIPCWYDPADVRDVVVHNGFGGAYLFALFPLPLFWFGCATLARGRRE